MDKDRISGETGRSFFVLMQVRDEFLDIQQSILDITFKFSTVSGCAHALSLLNTGNIY